MVIAHSSGRSLARLSAASGRRSCLAGRPSISGITPKAVNSAIPQQTRTLFTRKTPVQKAKARAWTATGLVLGGLLAVYAYDSNAGIHRWLFTPLLHAFTKDDPEASHRIAIKVLASGLSPRDLKADQEDVLGFDLWGRHFSNPVGLAAGFDKHGEAIDGLFNLGFGYVEIGSITPEAQDGNPKPRMFRLPSSQSVINRYGFNSEGHLAVLSRLQERIHAFLVKNAHLLPESILVPPEITGERELEPIEAILKSKTDAQVLDALKMQRSLSDGKVLAINLGKNKKSTAASIDDYVVGVQTLGPYADILVVNVSSPNTPGLRSLQQKETVSALLQDVMAARNNLKLSTPPAVLLKIAPDLSKQEVADIAAAAKESKVDGVIVSNTTISRPVSVGLDPAVHEQGGLSGPSVKPLAIRTLQTLYAYTDGDIPLVGCGGISTGQDALDYARAGASFVQLYTALGYQGVGLPRMIKDEIAVELAHQKKTWKDVVGSGIDLAGIRALGRESNPVGLMALEEEASDGLERLKYEVEAALSGEQIKLPAKLQSYEDRLAAFLPDWSDFSPAIASHSTTPSSVTSATSPESGMLPSGYPQIIIVDEPQNYKPRPAYTRADLEAKWAEAKETATRLEEQARKGGSTLQEAAKESQRAFAQLTRDIGEELHDVSDVTREAASQSGEAFREFGRDFRHDSVEAATTMRDIGEGAWKGVKDASSRLGHEVSQESREASEMAKEVGKGAWAEVTSAARHIGHDLRQEAHEAYAVAEGAAKKSTAAFGQAGHEIKQDSQEAASVYRTAGQESWGQSKEATSEVVADVKDEARSASGVIRGALQETGALFKALGGEIRQDTKNAARVAKDEAEGVAEKLRTEGAGGSSQRSGGGIWSLFSTFGERGNVSDQSRRLV